MFNLGLEGYMHGLSNMTIWDDFTYPWVCTESIIFIQFIKFHNKKKCVQK